eukprot:4403361-Amphidinium_carterae.1
MHLDPRLHSVGHDSLRLQVVGIDCLAFESRNGGCHSAASLRDCTRFYHPSDLGLRIVPHSPHPIVPGLKIETVGRR